MVALQSTLNGSLKQVPLDIQLQFISQAPRTRFSAPISTGSVVVFVYCVSGP